MNVRGGDPGSAFLLAAAAIAAGQIISYGRFEPHALILVTLAVGAGWWAALRSGRPGPSFSTGALVLAVEALVLVGLAHPPLTYCRSVTWLRGYALGMLGCAALVASYLVPDVAGSRLASRLRFALLVGLMVAARVSVPLASPQPGEDVWTVQQEAAAAALHGLDPYRVAYSQIFAPEVYSAFGYRSGFHYPPLALLPIVPAFALGHDIRWAYVVCELLVLAGLWMLSAGWARGRPRADRELLLCAWGLNASVLLVLEHSWTEPSGLALLVLALLLLRAGRRWSGALSLAALFSYKQYLLLAFPLLLFLPGPAPLLVCFAALTVSSYSPWLLGGVHGLVASLMEPWRAHPRPDGLSWAALWMQLERTVPPAWLNPLCLLGAMHLALARLPREPAGLVAALFLVLSALFLTAKQSFVNYYYFLGFLALVCVVLAGEGEEAGVAARPPADPAPSAAGGLSGAAEP